MPLHPQAKAYLEKTAQWEVDPSKETSIATARARSNLRPREPGPTVAKVEDRLIPGPESQIPIRIYTPFGKGPFPVLVWYHGGGWVYGNLDGTDGVCRHLTAGAECVVVSVDYRLAPEFKFPAAADDCYAATDWVSKNASSINSVASRLAVGGPSAGGNLTAAIALMARDNGGPSIAFQLVMVPCLEPRFDTPSYTANGEGYGLTKARMIWFWDQYLRSDEDAKSPYAAPLRAKDFSRLPPALIQTAEFDPLRDDGLAYHQRLKQAGMASTYKNYGGMFHLFFAAPMEIDGGRQALADACAALKAALSIPTTAKN